jgi:S-adenosylmethionine-diacylglycerol 3-amino-3-carboxypropyl transferase
MTELAPDAGFRGNEKLKDALLQHAALSPAGMSERVFGWLFSGLVYAQIWEDPEVDMQAMDLAEGHRIVTIGSGGCNMLAYLSRRPASIDVVDLNPNHIALNRLKLAAFRHLPDHASVRRLLGEHSVKSNVRLYDRHIAPNLDAATRRHWDARGLDGRRRIAVFNRNIYRTGLLGRFISIGHLIARSHGVRLEELAQTRSLREQRMFFDSRIAPLFDKPLIRWLTRQKSSLFGLGIPPQQYDELASLADDGTIAPVLRHRLEKLCCHFLLKDNYFAWQAFMRRYPKPEEGILPTYLQEQHYCAIRDAADRVTVDHASFTELLAKKPANSVDRYVLLDAQDWMNPRQLNELWTEITRTAAEGARVIFRTAAEESILNGKLAPDLLAQWDYHADRSQILNRQDRSAIYGGFHIYEKRPA